MTREEIDEAIERLEAKGYNRGAAMKIIGKVAAFDATIEQYEFAALNLSYVTRLNAEAEADARQAERLGVALNAVARGEKPNYRDLLGFEDE